MRRMREWLRAILILTFGAVVFYSGVRYYLKNRSLSVGIALKHEVRPEEKKSSPRDVASKKILSKEDLISLSGDKGSGKNSQLENSDSSLSMKLQIPLKKGEESSGSSSRHSGAAKSGFISDEEDEIALKRTEHGLCRSVEYRGYGFQQAQISQADWKKVVGQFHKAKKHLHAWLRSAQEHLSEKSITLMENQLENLKVVRPPSIEEPDLSWRGIGVWTRDSSGANQLRISSGFAKLVARQPKRGFFEMTRLVAQAWAPCELERVGVEAPWAPLLKCLEVRDEQGCSAGNHSEGGWAVSSSLAATLTPPGCTVPAFQRKERQACLSRYIDLSDRSATRRPAARHPTEGKENE